MRRVTIVGTSVAGIKTAQALRAYGFDGKITIYGEELGLIYDKPALSKEFLRGEIQLEDNLLITDEDISELDLEVLQGYSAVGLDPAQKEISFANGEIVRYETLVIATGARARESFWERREGMFDLRTPEDALGLRQSLETHGPDAAVLGAGFIGSEVAASLVQGGGRPYLIDPLPLPMQRGLDDVAGEWFRARHEREGVRLRLGRSVEEIRGEDHDFELVLSDGEVIPTSTIVLGLGAVPNVEWLEDSGVPIENGILTDPYCRVLDVPDVYAVGDVACVHSHPENIAVRREHWTTAVDHSTFIARQITGEELPAFGAVPYVWSDQYDWKMQIVGEDGGPHRWVIGDPFEGRAAIVYANEDGSFSRSITINWPRALILARRAAGTGGSGSELAQTLEGLL